LDFLMFINDSPQIPFERRMDLNPEDSGDDTDDESKPTKSLRKLIRDVPHRNYAATIEQFPEALEDLDPKDPETHPTSFLDAHDIDQYLYDIDRRNGFAGKAPPTPTPETPPHNGAGSQSANFALRNPTSVYNWLRRHAPKTFLQDLEKEKEKDKDKDKDKDFHDKEDGGTTAAKKKKKSGSSRGTKRQSTASRKDKERGAEPSETMDWDEDTNAADAQNTGSIRGKRKRDEDPGYRPKGGSSRPTKKRKSGGGARKSFS
jgi:hypothetical protein